MKTLTSEQQHQKMVETPVTKLLITLSLPAIITMLLSSIYNMADTYFVTSLGESAIGGVVKLSARYVSKKFNVYLNIVNYRPLNF